MSENEEIPFFNEKINKKAFQKITEISFDAMKEVAIKLILDGKTQSEAIKATTDVGVTLSKAILNLSKESCRKL